MKQSTSKKSRNSPIEDFIALPDEEKERIWESFNQEIPPSGFRPLNSGERKIWARAKKKMGRPVKGKGSKVISLSVERELLGKADRLAKKKGVTRASIVAAGLIAVLKRPNLLNDRPAAAPNIA
jgi:hypothetical protein